MDSLALLVTVEAVFPGVTASEESMREALASLSRDDALFTCARINAMVSGFGPSLSNHERQKAAIGQLCSLEEMRALSRYALKHGGPERVVPFFRGQLLELARWIALHCRHQEGDGETFSDSAVRSAFVRAALIASDLWQRRLFGGVIALNLDRDEQIRQFMGSFRKSLEEGNQAGHPGLTMSRGWVLFSRHLPKYLPDFAELFERSTNLTLRQYFICATALMNWTFSDHSENGRIFLTTFKGQPASRRCSNALSACFLRLQNSGRRSCALRQTTADISRSENDPFSILIEAGQLYLIRLST